MSASHHQQLGVSGLGKTSANLAIPSAVSAVVPRPPIALAVVSARCRILSADAWNIATCWAANFVRASSTPGSSLTGGLVSFFWKNHMGLPVDVADLEEERPEPVVLRRRLRRGGQGFLKVPSRGLGDREGVPDLLQLLLDVVSHARIVNSCQRPWKSGFRFSTNAVRPSFASSDASD